MIIFTILGIIFLVAILVNIVIAIIQEVLSKDKVRCYKRSHGIYWNSTGSFYIIPTIAITKGTSTFNHTSISISFEWLFCIYELYYYIDEE